MLNNRKKEIERWFLDAARERSTLFPDGEIENSEEPDFEIQTPTGPLGIEVTELLRKGEGPFPPVKEEKFHREVIELAKADYYRIPDAIPLRVLVSFWNREDGAQNKCDLAQELVEFVKSHPAGTYERRD